jgi:hypothetical protein
MRKFVFLQFLVWFFILYPLNNTEAVVYFKIENESYFTNDTLIIDSDDSSVTNINLQFGQTLNKTLKYDQVNSRFTFNDNLRVEGDLTTTQDLTIDGSTTIGSDSNDFLDINAKLTDTLDFNQNIADHLVFDQGTTFPSSPAEGQVFYKTDTDNFYIYDGTSWDLMNNSDNANTLDTIDSLQFIRSDVSDNYTTGALTFDSGTILDIDANTVRLDEITNNTIILDSDDTGGNIALQFGTTLNESLTWNNALSRFELSDDLNIANNLTVTGDSVVNGNITLGSDNLDLLNVNAKLNTNLDFNQKEADQLVLDKGSAFPPAPINGQIFYRSDENKLYIYDGAAWGETNGSSTLDQSYDNGGGGAGREIIIDSGAVKLNTGTGTYAPLELSARSSAPSTDLQNGQIYYGTDGIQYVYDSSRSKWLSVQRMTVHFGTLGDQALGYFQLLNTIDNTKSGWVIPRNAVITAYGVQSELDKTWQLQMRKNNVAISLDALNIVVAKSGYKLNANVDLIANDMLQAYVYKTTGDKPRNGLVWVEIAWRP